MVSLRSLHFFRGSLHILHEAVWIAPLGIFEYRLWDNLSSSGAPGKHPSRLGNRSLISMTLVDGRVINFATLVNLS